MPKEKYVQLDAAKSNHPPQWVLQKKLTINVRIYYDNNNQERKIYCDNDAIDDQTLKKLAEEM